MYLYRTARAAALALLIGGLAGTAIVRAVASEFEGVATSFWATLLVLLMVGMLVTVATYLASRRAADADPALTMRVE